MIPDFPVTKDKLQKVCIDYVNARIRVYMGILDLAETRRNYEGLNWHLTRSDGSESSTPYEEVESRFMIHDDEIPNLSPSKVKEKLDLLAQNIASKMRVQFLNAMITDPAVMANSINASGQGFTAELFLNALEGISMDFDTNGEPVGLAFIVPPGMDEVMLEASREADRTPEFQQRYDNIIARKRQEFNDRENSRKLVD